MEASRDLTEGLDETQVQLLAEECIVIDSNDKPIGSASKKSCHLWENISKGMLHRAFSVFIFNTEGKLLLQQRSNKKITYPGHWTNTCCSHPLNLPTELPEEDVIGVKTAARRKLQHELGIEPKEVALDKLMFLTRIHYKAVNVPDPRWGEHEIDYILFMQKDVDLDVNPNEVETCQYVNQKELQHILEQAERGDVLVTPWFKLIVERFLPKWWNNLSDLSSVKDTSTIHRM